MSAALAFSRPKRVARRPKSWFDMAQAALPVLAQALIAVPMIRASQVASSSSKANAASKCSMYGCQRALGR
jgi:hypothetical protein